MSCAYVLINTEKGFEKSVLKELKKLPAIKETYLTNGVYDIIVKTNIDSIDELRKIIAYDIRPQDKIKSTLTMTIIERKSDDTHPNRKSVKVPPNSIANTEGVHAPQAR
ncbi:MAG: Lrp/AsnC ligand binding domain-containing protein [Candidatus Bathyarchaeota archaeon]|nr:Lrp/AsnC ligand binding domain-containing protein [Candidatus Bathyarchaeota archaeon]